MVNHTCQFVADLLKTGNFKPLVFQRTGDRQVLAAGLLLSQLLDFRHYSGQTRAQRINAMTLEESRGLTKLIKCALATDDLELLMLIHESGIAVPLDPQFYDLIAQVSDQTFDYIYSIASEVNKHKLISLR